MRQALRVRRFVFTINHYEVEVDAEGEEGGDVRPLTVFESLARLEGRFKGVMFGYEEGEEEETPHLQGYLETFNPITVAGLQRFDVFRQCGAAIFEANGSVESNRAYTSKEGAHVEWGQFSEREGQGARTDWAMVHELARSNASIAEFAEAVPHLAYPHVSKIPMWIQIHDNSVRDWKTVPIIYIGPPRCGKSTRMRAKALELANGDQDDVYFKSDKDKWWPGYRSQSVVCIDEMDGAYFPWSLLLKIVEEGPYVVQYKGGDRNFKARFIIMTSNAHPCDWYPNKVWDADNAFRARIEEFGQLWLFRRPEVIEGVKTYLEPTRDLELLPYVDPVAERERAQRLADFLRGNRE